MAKNSVKAIELALIDSSTLTPAPAYQAINPDGLQQTCFFLRIVNNSNVLVQISYDGATDHDVVTPNGGVLEIPSQANAQPQNLVAKFAKGTIVYAAAAAAGMGNVYVTGYYQPL